jgi:hypothetical protein
MSGRIYNRIANVALLLGIASAFLYDSGKVPNWLAIAIGVVAGVIAVAVYFWNQHKEKKDETAGPGQVAEIVAAETALKPKRIEIELMTKAAAELGVLAAMEAASVNLSHYVAARVAHRMLYHDLSARHELWHVGPSAQKWLSLYSPPEVYPGRSLRYTFPKGLRLMTPEVELSPVETANCVVHIMRTLAIQDRLNELDYVFDEKGLRVSLKMSPLKEPQGQLMFEELETPV